MINEPLTKFPLENEAIQIELIDNVLDFPSKLRSLRTPVSTDVLKRRNSSEEQPEAIGLIGWQIVADILDRSAPGWSYRIKGIKQLGKIITVVAAICIDGISREGIGTAFADSDFGLREAEQDALKRAAAKFGVARDLELPCFYSTEKNDSETPLPFPDDPIAKTLLDLVTSKQLGMIRSITRTLDIDPDVECRRCMECRTNELSRSAAAAFIRYLDQLGSDQSRGLRRAG